MTGNETILSTAGLMPPPLIFVFHGSPTGLSDTPDWMSTTRTESASTAGDLNADGYADLLIGEPVDPVTNEPSLHLSWGSACSAGDADFVIYTGLVGDFGNHAPLSCTTSGAPELFIPFDSPFPPDPVRGQAVYFLAVPVNVLGGREGSYRYDSLGQTRLPTPGNQCYPQAVSACAVP